MRAKVRSNSSRKLSPNPCRCFSYKSAAPSKSSSASGWLTMRIQLFANILDDFFNRPAVHLTFGNFCRASLNDVVPLSFSIGIYVFVEAGDQLLGEVGAVRRGQGQSLRYFFSSNTHVDI